MLSAEDMLPKSFNISIYDVLPRAYIGSESAPALVYKLSAATQTRSFIFVAG